MKKALITGISGQDGSYLSEYLINLGYEVHGIVRRHSVAENQDNRISNLNITTHWATNVISTMYGTVEEHSEQRYYDIQISGTTGMAPRYYDRIERMLEEPDIKPDSKTIKATAPSGRSGYAVKDLIDTGGFGGRTKDLINSALNSAADLFGEEQATAGLSDYRTG